MRAGRPGIGGGWRPRSPSEKIQSPRTHLFAMSDCRGDTRHARPSLTPGCHGPPGYMFMQDTKPAKGQGEPEPGSQASCSVRPPDGRPSVPRSFQKRAVPQHSNSAERQHPPQGDAGAETRPTQLHGVSIILSRHRRESIDETTAPGEHHGTASLQAKRSVLPMSDPCGGTITPAFPTKASGVGCAYRDAASLRRPGGVRRIRAH